MVRAQLVLELLTQLSCFRVMQRRALLRTPVREQFRERPRWRVEVGQMRCARRRVAPQHLLSQLRMHGDQPAKNSELAADTGVPEELGLHGRRAAHSQGCRGPLLDTDSAAVELEQSWEHVDDVCSVVRQLGDRVTLECESLEQGQRTQRFEPLDVAKHVIAER